MPLNHIVPVMRDSLNVLAGVVRKSKFEGTRLVFDNDVADDVTVDEGQEEQPLDGQTGVPRIKYKKLATSILQQVKCCGSDSTVIC